jgi:hypothetical protein
MNGAINQFRRAIASVRRLWSELDYAQRRALEIKTGVSLTTPGERPGFRRRMEELERLYAADWTYPEAL